MIYWNYREKGIAKNKDSGITLMALVITIIILLILSGISIGMLSGDNSIIKQARNAKTQTDISQEKEILEHAAVAAIGKSKYGNLEKDYLDAELNKYSEIEGTEKVDEGIEVAFKSGRIYLVDADGNVSEVIPPDRTGLEIGDYIDYEPDVVSTAYNLSKNYTNYSSITSITQENLDWQILRVYNNGSIDLIGSPTSQKVGLRGALGYNNGVYILNDVCKTLYSKSSKNIIAKSINIEDIEYWLTDAGVQIKNNSIGASKTYNDPYMYYPDLYQYEKNSGIDSNIADSDGIDLSESYDGYSSGLTQNKYTNTTSGLLTAKNTYYKLAINSENIKDEANSVIYNESDYWVASRSIFLNLDGSGGVNFCLRVCGTNLYSGTLFNGLGIGESGADKLLRPVVTLKKNTKVQNCLGTNSKDNPHIIESY